MLNVFRILILAFTTLAYADNTNMKPFPLEHYSQNADTWISPLESDYQINLLDDEYQLERFEQLKHTYFGTGIMDNSPWSKSFVSSILLQQTNAVNLANSIIRTLDHFDNTIQKQKFFGVNIQVYTSEWLDAVKNNINLNSFHHLKYSNNKLAIATNNLSLRALPTTDPAYYSSSIPGEGYPFDNLQASAVYAGTPLYVLGYTIDKKWAFILAPEYIGWVKSNGIAYVDNNFISSWQKVAYRNLAGIKKSDVAIVDTHNQLQFSGYVGMMFPIKAIHGDDYEILIPIKQSNGKALISNAILKSDAVAKLPLSATPSNFAMIIKSIQGRPYGWGNLGFYNDCSAEMKAIFTMFGFYMPRNSKNQALAGLNVDISNLTPKERANYLIKNGNPFFTLVQLPGHILLYIGDYRSRGMEYPMTYQQMWGLSPSDGSSRSVIGKSVFFPLLLKYPEDTSLSSELDKKKFNLIYLDQAPEKQIKPTLKSLLGE